MIRKKCSCQEVKGKYFAYMDKYLEVKYYTVGKQSKFKKWCMNFFCGLEWIEIKGVENIYPIHYQMIVL